MGNIIIISFYAVFLIIFLLTAIVSLGGILQVGPFQNIESSMRKWLVGALLIELVGAVILTYRNLPKPDWEATLPFSLSITYADYVDDWRKSLRPFQQDCVDLYLEGYSPSNCSDTVSRYEEVKSIIGDHGLGDLYLGTASGSNREGVALYLFPGGDAKIVMDVTGHQEAGGEITLTFKQPKRYARQADGSILERPGYVFTIGFKPNADSNNIYRGVLYHPQIKIEGKPMKLADALLVRKAS